MESPSPTAAVNLPSALRLTSDSSRFLAGTVLIAVVVFAAYLSAIGGGFLFDDDVLLTENPFVRAPGGLISCWFTTHQPDYVPFTVSTFWLEWRLWGMHPAGYRVTNLLLHILACVLLWILLQKLDIPGGFLAALLFAVHPVNVESVAWIEQRKNTLSMVLLLLSILSYLRRAGTRGDGRRTKAGDVVLVEPACLCAIHVQQGLGRGAPADIVADRVVAAATHQQG